MIYISKITLDPYFMNKIMQSPAVITEDLGKMFEKGICGAYGIPYIGKYKYSEEQADAFAKRLQLLPSLFPDCTHTAEKGAQYDFTANDNNQLHLSAKTNKKGYKICPQKIGQPTKQKFCEYFDIDPKSTNDDIKQYIMVNLKSMLPHYFNYTFDSPIVYYNQHTDKIVYINTLSSIEWEPVACRFSHMQNNTQWNESTTVSMVRDDKSYSVAEFQIHNNRNGVKFRWNLDTLLKYFPQHFDVTQLSEK